jgi:hypothetical protein
VPTKPPTPAPILYKCLHPSGRQGQAAPPGEGGDSDMSQCNKKCHLLDADLTPEKVFPHLKYSQ